MGVVIGGGVIARARSAETGVAAREINNYNFSPTRDDSVSEHS